MNTVSKAVAQLGDVDVQVNTAGSTARGGLSDTGQAEHPPHHVLPLVYGTGLSEVADAHRMSVLSTLAGPDGVILKRTFASTEKGNIMIQTKTEILSSTARAMVEDALNHAQENGWEVAVAIYDPSGGLVAFGRSDRVAMPSIQFALDKAWTAAGLGKSTQAFGQRALEIPSLGLGIGGRDRLMVWGGGVAILHSTGCIGGIGVSGAQEEEDIACAQAAIHKAGLTSG